MDMIKSKTVEESRTKIYAVYEEYETKRLCLNDITFFFSEEDALTEFNNRKKVFLENVEFDTNGEFMYDDAEHADTCVLFIHKRSRYEMYLNVAAVDVKRCERMLLLKEKEKALKEMETALRNLRQAWYECVISFSNAHINEDYLIGEETELAGYPFHMSFDEINVIGWVDAVLERLGKSSVSENEAGREEE